MPDSAAIKAGRAYVEAFLDGTKLEAGLKAAQAKLAAWGAGITAVGAKIAGLGAAITAPLLGAAAVFEESAIAIGHMSERTGIGIEALSALGLAARRAGTDSETLETSIKKMQIAINKGGQGSKEARLGFAQLGVSLKELQGLSPEQQFERIAQALAGIEDPARRTALAVQIFGRGGTAVIAIAKQMKNGLAGLVEEARRLGITLTAEDVESAHKFRAVMGELKAALMAVTLAIGRALLPFLTEARNEIMPMVANVVAWIRENAGLAVSLLKIGTALTATGLGLIVLGKAVGVLSMGFGYLASVVGLAFSAITFLLSPIGLVTAAAVGLSGYLVYQSGLWDQWKTAGVTAWGGIVDAVKSGDLALAMKIAWAGIKLVWTNGIQFLAGIWNDFTTNFSKGLLVIGYYLGAITKEQGKAMNDALNQMHDFEKSRLQKEAGDAMKELLKLRQQAADKVKEKAAPLANAGKIIARMPQAPTFGESAGTFSAAVALRMANPGRGDILQKQLDKAEEIRQATEKIDATIRERLALG